MAKLSIEITGKIRSALFVLSALAEQGPVVARLVADKLRAGLKGGEEPLDFLTLIRGLGQILKSALDLMVELDNLLVAENQRRAALLQDREDKLVELSQRVIGVRRIITGHFVDPDLARLGLDGRTARESVALQRQAELICERLVRDDVADLLGESLFQPALDLQTYEPQIALFVDALRDAHDAHQRSRRRVDELLARRREAVTDYDTAFVRVARQFEDFCRLAKLDELADKVRPSLTRKGETAVKPDDGEEPAEGAPTGDGADSAPATEDPATEDPAAAEPAAASAADPQPEPGAEPGAEPVSEPDGESVSEPATEPAAAN